MKCKVIDKSGNIYFSKAFGLIENGFETEVMVLDYTKTRLVLLSMYITKPYIIRKIFPFGYHDDKWVNTTIQIGRNNVDISLYPWLKNYFSKYLDEIELPKEIMNKVLEIDANVFEEEWHYIKDKNDIEELMTFALDFHDGEIASIHYETSNENSDRLVVRVSNCWNVTIELVFEENIEINFHPYEGYYIYDSAIIFHDGKIIFVDEYIEEFDEIGDNMVWFSGKSIKWRYELELENEKTK